jgi:hypothetical protein
MNPKKSRTNCLNCGKETDRHSTKYCSNLCQSIHQNKLRIEIVNTTGDFKSGFKSSYTIRRIILGSSENRCSICSLTEWRGSPIPLILDHIDGNSDNWLKTNLRLVCGNCDMQLPTYKGRNRGNGRHSRRVRYAKGQSY